MKTNSIISHKLKELKGLACLATLLALTSCYTDDTSLANLPISEITIDKVGGAYYLAKNDLLTITPAISQTHVEKPLTYKWEVNQQVVSTEPTFKWEAKLLGTYHARLIVTNEDGSSFFPFTIYVNSPYEEGITILSTDGDGKSMLSFMLNQVKPADGPDAFYAYDCFDKNNSTMQMADMAVDITQCNGSLIVACKGSSNSPATIYYLNEKTFIVENQLTAPNYPDFKPTQLLVPSIGTSGLDYPILCEGGKVYAFSATEGALAQSHKLKSKYGTTALIADNRTAGGFTIVLWDEEANDLCNIYSGYGPFFCGKEYLLQRQNLTEANNYFVDQQFVRLCQIDRPSVGGTPLSKLDAECIVITKRNVGMMVRYSRTILLSDFWNYNEDEGVNQLIDNGGEKTIAVMQCPITDKTPMIASSEHKFAYFAQGNKLYRWYYNTSTMLDKCQTTCIVGSADAVITALNFSPDHSQTYIAYYEPSESGMNGHLTIIDTATGEHLQQYNNICYRPTRIIYKEK